MNGSFFRDNNFSDMIPNSPNYSDFLNTSNNSGMSNGNANNFNKMITNPTPNMSFNSYAQNVLQKNIGITGYFFVSFPDSVDWRDKIFYGVLTEAGDDYILIYNEDNQEYYLIWSIYLNYATFDRKPNTN